jgi:Fe-S-cluster containining protein
MGLPVVKNSYENKDLCRPCGGKCCKNLPGAAFPEDFGYPDIKAMESNILNALMSGKWSIDWWENSRTGPQYYLRPATVQSVGRVFDPSYGGQCNFLTDEGCSIFDNRPTGCRGLEPKEGRCIVRYGDKEEAKDAWTPFNKLLKEIGDLVDGDRHIAMSEKEFSKDIKLPDTIFDCIMGKVGFMRKAKFPNLVFKVIK